jgi:hypothetical protein
MTAAWRIPWIPRRHQPRPPVWSTVACLLGAAMFLGGVAATLWFANLWFVVVAVGGWLVGLAALGLAARGRRRHWRRVPATCIDREVRQTVGLNKGHPCWEARLLCAYDRDGSLQEVTLDGSWIAFRTRAAAERHLDRRIADDGRCELYVNPDDPTEAELVGQGIKDWLLVPSRLRRPAG